MSRQTVDSYVNRLKQTDKSYKELLKLDDESLQVLAFQEQALPVLINKFADLQSRLPGFAEDLKNSKITRIILWKVYRQQVPDGY